MREQEKPVWMNDPKVKNISPDKLMFLQKMVFESKGLSQKELLPFLMALAGKSKANRITFSEDEMSLLIDVLKNYSTPDEVRKMNQIMKMMHKK